MPSQASSSQLSSPFPSAGPLISPNQSSSRIPVPLTAFSALYAELTQPQHEQEQGFRDGVCTELKNITRLLGDVVEVLGDLCCVFQTLVSHLPASSSTNPV